MCPSLLSGKWVGLALKAQTKRSPQHGAAM
ncbi:Uncharacterised protein [Vibrio cholerae]|nr:Uncharacterised protein [Vibrio cholerae]